MRQIDLLTGLFITERAIIGDQLQKLAPAVYAMDTTHILISVDNGNMADDRFHPLVDRCKDDDMAAGIGNAPGPDLVGVDRRVALSEADGVLIIPDRTSVVSGKGVHVRVNLGGG